MKKYKHLLLIIGVILIVGLVILKAEWIDSISSENMLKGFLILCGILATAFFVNRVIDLFKKKPKGKIDMNSIHNREMIGRRVKR